MSAVKTAVNNTASVAIIYNAVDPRQLFIEIKDDGHPIKLVRRQLCPIGGNWIGEPAIRDRGPIDTVRREIDEELSLERPMRTSLELALLGHAEPGSFQPTPVSDREVTGHDRALLAQVKRSISVGCAPFISCLCTTTAEAMQRVDPQSTRASFTALINYFTAPLPLVDWAMLVELQERFGNLSNESITLITSPKEIARLGTQFSFGHDEGYRLFYHELGLSEEADMIPIVPGVVSLAVEQPFETYAECLEHYDIAKKPI